MKQKKMKITKTKIKYNIKKLNQHNITNTQDKTYGKKRRQ